MKTTKNFWPLGIAIFMLFMVCMIILTIYISIKFKPDEDKSYFSTRQVVDKEINSLLIMQSELENQYKFFIINHQQNIPLQRKASRKSKPLYFSPHLKLEFKIENNTNSAIKADSVKLYLTRFADAKDDIDVGEMHFVGDRFVSPNISLKKGAWKALVEFKVGDKKAYFEQFIFVE